MSTTEFISLRDAADLAGVSKKTIERAYKKYLKQHGLTVETASEILRVNQQGNRKQFFIAEAFVRDTVMKEGTGSARSRASSVDSELVNQLRVKDDQIASAQQHILQLTARLEDAQKSLQAEQALHLNSQERRRPLLGFTQPKQDSGDRGRVHQVDWKIVAGAVMIGTCAVVLSVQLWLTFVT